MLDFAAHVQDTQHTYTEKNNNRQLLHIINKNKKQDTTEKFEIDEPNLIIDHKTIFQ